MRKNQHNVFITSPSIQLDQLIKWVGLSETGGQAKIWVDEGKVNVNGRIVSEKRKKIYPDDTVIIGDEEYHVLLEETGNNACK